MTKTKIGILASLAGFLMVYGLITNLGRFSIDPVSNRPVAPTRSSERQLLLFVTYDDSAASITIMVNLGVYSDTDSRQKNKAERDNREWNRHRWDRTFAETPKQVVLTVTQSGSGLLTCEIWLGFKRLAYKQTKGKTVKCVKPI